MCTLWTISPDSPEQVRLSQLLPPAFFPVHRDLKEARHLHYWLSGGRGSFVSLELLLGVMARPGVNGVVFRKVKDTLRDSVFAQMCWAAQRLGVADLWKCSESPLRMTYLPTGQVILFRGLDKANKAKSLKAPEGYFGLVWFEELDEFSGMEEIRSVLQTTLRGGERYAVFYTYNPPPDRRAWVNLQAGVPREDRLVFHSDYRSMPPQWLGEPFLAEARHLEQVNPEAYRQEYLGLVTGLGGEVFRNLNPRPISDQEIREFPSILRGLDWGYASDPLHYTCCRYDRRRRRLLIFFELHRTGLSNAAAAQAILEEMRLHGKGYVCCDSAEPKSIDDLHRLGVPVFPARKGPDSVRRGIRFLSRELEEIVIDPVRCPNTYREFSQYQLRPAPDGGFLPSFPDRDNHSIDAVRYALEYLP